MVYCLNINHTYESTGSQFPSGEIKLFDSAFSLKNNSEEMSSMIWESTEKLKKAQSDEEEFEAVENLIRNYAAAEIGERGVLIFQSLIDELADWDRNSFLEGHMDLDKVGAFGHSQGGSAVGQAMIKDNRIDAGMNLDGAQWGTVIDSVLQKPFASIASDWDADHPDLNKHAYRNGSTSAFFDVKIKDSGHSNFMDIILLVNLRMINQAGKIDAYEGTRQFLILL